VKPLLFVRCDAVETFGIAPSAAEATGSPIVIWEPIDGHAERPDLSSVAGVVVFGSTYNVEDADDQPFIKGVADVTRECVERDIPLLGLCFGAQVLVWSLGGDVTRAPVREIGFEPIRVDAAASTDPVLGHYRDGDWVFHWHMDAFDPPQGAELLARGDAGQTQAIRVGTSAWATQFHAEVDRNEAEYWVSLASAEEDLERTWGKSPERIRREVARHMADHERRGRQTFRRFVEVARGRA
jgi:GMP synthase (glutamine-hydrolysing)